MRTKDYVKKYKLDQGKEFKHNSFVEDLTQDFAERLSSAKSRCADFTIDIFNKTVSEMRDKWSAINNKTFGELPEKLWNYFYATVIMKEKEILFPNEVNQG